MCDGGPTRPSIGGGIVILKPIYQDGRPTLRRELSLRLIAEDNGGTSKAIINGVHEDEKFLGSEILIHKDGDLRFDTTSDSSVLHRLALPKDFRPGAVFQTDAKLDVTVGGEGIIGRRVSLMNHEDCIGAGIVGWN